MIGTVCAMPLQAGWLSQAIGPLAGVGVIVQVMSVSILLIVKVRVEGLPARTRVASNVMSSALGSAGIEGIQLPVPSGSILGGQNSTHELPTKL